MSFFRNYESSPLVIAELGTSHNGDLGKALEMIAAAAEAGAGCVKFQMVFADEILHPNTGEVDLPGGKIRLYDRFKQLESPPEFFERAKEYAESRGILFLCTPFGPKSAAILRDLKPQIVKIASPELNYTGLLAEIARWGIPVLLSSGVSTLGDIENALATLADGGQKPSVCLLHCVTSYPAPESDYNLRVLNNLRAIFGVPVGVSDHSLNPELVPVLALGQGAPVIEKHFCLSRGDPGLDDPIALPPDEFRRMVAALNDARKAGAGASITALARQYGEQTIERVLGTGVKSLAPSEKANYRRTNRSLHALRNIGEGELIAQSDIGVLRTEKILRPGLAPCWETLVAGRRARAGIPCGEGIRFEDI